MEPPTPLTPLGTAFTDARPFLGNGEKTRDTPEAALSTEDVSHSVETIKSPQGNYLSSPTQAGRSSSENTALNIYNMYGTAGTERDSYVSHLSTATSRPSDQHASTTRPSQPLPASGYGHETGGLSVANSGFSSAKESVYETPSQSPAYPTPPISAPKKDSELRREERDQSDGRDGYGAQGQYIYPGRVSPAVVIDPPPGRSSRQSMRSNKSNPDGAVDDRGRFSISSSRRPSSSSLAARESFSPTRVSTDPATSATSSSAQSSSKNPLPSPLAPMAPSLAPNEDPDSYFVRATYAALDVSGVRGDGYEEGEELTRARLGSGRGNLPSPPPNTAKQLASEAKELNKKEIEILSQLDRPVPGLVICDST